MGRRKKPVVPPTTEGEETNGEKKTEDKPQDQTTDAATRPEDGQVSQTATVNSRGASPLAPTSTEPSKKRKPRRTKEQMEVARLAESTALQTTLLETSTKSCRVLVNGINPLIQLMIPPALVDDEKDALVQGWTPVIMEHGGDIPPMAAAVIVSLAVLVPRIVAAFTGHPLEVRNAPKPVLHVVSTDTDPT